MMENKDKIIHMHASNFSEEKQRAISEHQIVNSVHMY